MRVLFLTSQGDGAGSTYSISYLAAGLAAKGHEIYVGCRPECDLYGLLKNTEMKLIPIAFGRKLDLKLARKLRDIIVENKIELVNAQSSVDRYIALLAVRLFGAPAKFVVTRRQMPKSSGGKLKGRVFGYGADMTIAVSGAVKDALVTLGIPEDRIQVIYNGTPKEKYGRVSSFDMEAMKNSLNINGYKVIGCVSRMKEQETLLRALQYLPDNLVVLFLGIKCSENLEKIRKSLRLRQDIRYMGFVDNPLSYYPLFTVQVLPSTMEGLSQSILEGMALGVPIVATSAGGNTEVIVDGQNGFLVPSKDPRTMADRIRLLINDESLRAEFSGREHTTALETFNIEHTIERTEKLFSEIIYG